MPIKKVNTDLSKRQMDEIQALKNLPDDQINTADIPEITDWSGAKRGVVYRMARRQDAKTATDLPNVSSRALTADEPAD